MGNYPSVYPFDEISAEELGFKKFSRSSEVLFIFSSIFACLIMEIY